MRTRPSTIVIAAAAVAAIAAAPAPSDEPGGSAGASAVEVDGVVTISGTDASTHDGGSANATVIGVGGETLVGGSQEGTGSDGGEIVTTGETDQGSITVGGWSTEVADDRSQSESSVLSARSADEDGPRVEVLTSSSDASSSGSRAETTGARASMGENSLTILRAVALSSGDGSAYLLGLNDQRIATSEDANGECQIEAAPLADVLCLYAEAIQPGGEGTDGEDGTPAGSGVSTGIVDAALADDNIAADLFTTTATQSDGGSATVGDSSTPAGDTDTNPAPATQAGSLPRTGGGLAMSALGLLGMGGAVGLRRFGRR